MKNIFIVFAILIHCFTAPYAECMGEWENDYATQMKYKDIVIQMNNPELLLQPTKELFIAVLNNHHHTIRRLIREEGADPNAQIAGGFTPLHLAVLLNRTLSVHALLSNPTTNRNMPTFHGITPLQIAYTLNSQEMIQILSATPISPLPSKRQIDFNTDYDDGNPSSKKRIHM